MRDSEPGRIISQAANFLEGQTNIGLGWQGGDRHLTAQTRLPGLGVITSNASTRRYVKLADGQTYEASFGLDKYSPTSYIIGPYEDKSQIGLQTLTKGYMDKKQHSNLEYLSQGGLKKYNSAQILTNFTGPHYVSTHKGLALHKTQKNKNLFLYMLESANTKGRALQESELRLVKDASNLLESLAEKRSLPELAIVVGCLNSKTEEEMELHMRSIKMVDQKLGVLVGMEDGKIIELLESIKGLHYIE